MSLPSRQDRYDEEFQKKRQEGMEARHCRRAELEKRI
jgi:hypothetical protein